MEDTTKALFEKLDGTPAHALVIVGLLLSLLAPLIVNFKAAGVARAGVAAEQAEELQRLDMADFIAKQEQEKKADDSNPSLTFEQKGPREQARTQAAEAKREELKNTYNITASKRAFMDATTNLVGSWMHYVISFLGALLLLIGLMVMTVQSDGVRQKVILVILVVVMFSALSGVNLNLEGKGNFGSQRSDLIRALMDAMPKSSPSSSRP